MSDIAEKWGELVARRGFAQVPNHLLLLNHFLDKDSRLSPVELLVLIELVGSWWKKDALPFPSMATLAIRCGVSSRQIQRAMNRLEALGLVQRVSRRERGIISSNAYDLAPLVEVLDRVARAYPNEFPRNIRGIAIGEAPSSVPATEDVVMEAESDPVAVTTRVRTRARKG
jgi:hypothetical protein